MKESQRKTWNDPLIDAANKEGTTAERRLHSMLREIARTKYGGVPPQIIGELQRINDKVRFKWHPGPWWGKRGPHLTSDLEEPNSERIPGIVLKDLRGIWDDQMYYRFILDLIPKLRDRNWVEALRECPGCRKLMLSKAKKRKFCSDQCKKKIWARESRRRAKEEKTINQGEDFREAKVEVRCRSRSCEWQESKGKFENYIKSYSGSMDCPKCGNVHPLHIVTTWNKEKKDWIETQYGAYEWDEFIEQYRKERR